MLSRHIYNTFQRLVTIRSSLAITCARNPSTFSCSHVPSSSLFLFLTVSRAPLFRKSILLPFSFSRVTSAVCVCISLSLSFSITLRLFFYWR